MNKNLNGVTVSDILYRELKKYCKNKNVLPKVIDIIIGNDFSSLMYSKMKKKKIEELGFIFELKHFDKIDIKNLLSFIEKCNKDNNINGIMIQLPLPNNLKKYERLILDSIDIKKDIDGLNSKSLGNLMVNNKSFIPCTALGIISLLKSYNIKLSGKKVCIIGRSNIVGKPLEQLFLEENSTTFMCHSYTENLKNISKNADILIVAINKKEYIKKDYIKNNAIVIDVGINKKGNKIVGDIDYNNVIDKVSLITPCIGGVGPMTICMLCYNVAYSIYGDEILKILYNGIKKAKKKIKH